MIDHLIIIYKNYYLLKLQVENFKKRFTKPYPFNLIILDNTPNNQKMSESQIHDYLNEIDKNREVVKTFLSLDSIETFDGISHGRALDEGLKLCKTDIVCVTDSDFFWVDPNIYEEALHRINNENYLAFGTEYNDGTGDSFFWRNKSPSSFNEIPAIFGAFYTRQLATSDSWVVTPEDVSNGKEEGFVEVGFKIRKKILQNSFKTFTYKTELQGIPYTSHNWKPCVFMHENKVKGIHCVGGSHANNTLSTMEKLIKAINNY